MNNNNFLFADGIFLVCSIICIFSNLLSFFPFVFGVFLCTSVAHLFYFYKSKKSLEALENVISDKESEAENLKSSFKLKIESIKSETENRLKNTEKEIKNLLSEKTCRNRLEFYQNYAKSQEFKDFKVVLGNSKSEQQEILNNLEEFLDLKGIKIKLDNFCETVDYLKNLNLKYDNINNQIKYRANATNLKSTDLQDLKNILKEKSNLSFNFDGIDINAVRSRFAELEKMNLHSAYIETQKKIINTSEDPEKLKKYAEKLRFQKGKIEEYYECLKISLDALEEVSDELRKNFNPKLNGRASEIFKDLTGGKYKSLYIQKDYDFIVGGEVMDRYSHYFSSGTIDQAYLAARIAISELVSNAKIPLIFDETLMQYDDERLKNTIKFLKEYAETNVVQSIIFTCHDYLKNIIEMAVKGS